MKYIKYKDNVMLCMVIDDPGSIKSFKIFASSSLVITPSPLVSKTRKAAHITYEAMLLGEFLQPHAASTASWSTSPP